MYVCIYMYMYIYIYIYIFLNMLHNVIYIMTRYKILYNMKHHIRYFIHMNFSSLLTLMETNFAKVLTDFFKKLYQPLITTTLSIAGYLQKNYSYSQCLMWPLL